MNRLFVLLFLLSVSLVTYAQKDTKGLSSRSAGSSDSALAKTLAEELKNIGVTISDELEKKIIKANELRIEQRNKTHEATMLTGSNLAESDANFAFIVGYTSGGFPYGLTHEEMKQFKSEDTD